MLAEERLSTPANRKMLPPPSGKSPWDAVDVDSFPDLYAMQASGDCMMPEIADGTVLVFDKLSRCRPGDTVVIFKTASAVKPGHFPALVKRLIEPFPEFWHPENNLRPVLTVESLNPRQRFYLREDEVAAVHRCLGPAAPQPNGSVGVSQKVIDAARAGK